MRFSPHEEHNTSKPVKHSKHLHNFCYKPVLHNQSHGDQMKQILPAKVLPVSYSSLRVLAIMAYQGLHQFSHMDHLLESAVAKHSTQVSVKQLHVTFNSWQCM